MTDEVQDLAIDAPTPDPVIEQENQPDESGTPETVTETDEQINERVQKEAQERAERKARGVQKRIDELTADKHAERKRAEELAAQNARLLAMLEGRKDAPQPQEAGEPQLEDYQDIASYIKARDAYVLKQASESAKRAAAELAEQERYTAYQRMQEQARMEAERAHMERVRKFAEKTPDYFDVIEDADVVLPISVGVYLKTLNEGPMLAYHFAKNPQLAQQFNSTPPEMHGVLIGQMLSTLKSSPSISQAPAPGKPVQSKPGSSSEPPSDPDKYWEWAQKHMR